MTQPDTTGEAIQIIRRALYDLARAPGRRQASATQLEVINYAIERKWPVPARDFEKAMEQLIAAGAAIDASPWTVAETVTQTRYQLTAVGDLTEEFARRRWISHVIDELRRPRTFVEFAFALLGFGLGLVSGLLLRASGP